MITSYVAQDGPAAERKNTRALQEQYQGLLQYCSLRSGVLLLLVQKSGAPGLDVSIRGRRLTSLLHLQTSAEHSGTAFTHWVTLKGDYTLDVHRPFRPGTPTRQLKSPL
ncbi:hypothetical protein TNCV_1135121 [Trichonephila clavipes]|nr:hypothetical protein TNCV_1135121 [Trichonephila clavipes]